jgi:FixJ family two-component response regulator
MTDSGLHVYVVDDDDAVRDSLRQLLESKGHSVRTFESATAFLNGFSPESAGCILADIHMPGMSGLELQAALLEKASEVPIIIITGNADVPSAITALKSGALDFIEKPIRSDSLLAAVSRAISERQAALLAVSLRNKARQKIGELTPREQEVLRHLIAGHSNKIIAFHLGISPRTVENHRAHLMLKTDVASVAELVQLAMAAGLTAAAT